MRLGGTVASLLIARQGGVFMRVSAARNNSEAICKTESLAKSCGSAFCWQMLIR
jgi:hypothetical protein